MMRIFAFVILLLTISPNMASRAAAAATDTSTIDLGDGYSLAIPRPPGVGFGPDNPFTHGIPEAILAQWREDSRIPTEMTLGRTAEPESLTKQCQILLALANKAPGCLMRADEDLGTLSLHVTKLTETAAGDSPRSPMRRGLCMHVDLSAVREGETQAWVAERLRTWFRSFERCTVEVEPPADATLRFTLRGNLVRFEAQLVAAE